MRFLLPLLALAALSPEAVAAPDRRVTLDPLPVARVGRVAGTRAFIGLSLADGRVRVYVCDGTTRRRPTIAKWFTGRWDGRGALTIVRGRHTLNLDSVEGGRLAGPHGTHAFGLRPATPPAGLYHRARRGTWIALSRRSARGTFASPRPKRCVPVPITGPGGTVEYKIVCR
jgi:hypothetical protein